MYVLVRIHILQTVNYVSIGELVSSGKTSLTQLGRRNCCLVKRGLTTTTSSSGLLLP